MPAMPADVGQGSGRWLERWRQATEEFAAGDPGRSVLLQGHGATVGVAADTPRPGASVLKLFIAIAAHLAGAAGQLDLAATAAITDLPDSRWPSVLTALHPDHRFTMAELAGLMMATGDNRIAEHLATTLGFDAVNRVACEVGCRSTRVAIGFADPALGPAGRANVTTAADCAIALHAVWTRPALAPLRTAMRSSLFNSRILALLPDDVVVAHKTGTLSGVVNDIGVIHASTGDFTACFLTDAQHDPAATAQAIARCALAAHDGWQAR